MPEGCMVGASVWPWQETQPLGAAIAGIASTRARAMRAPVPAIPGGAWATWVKTPGGNPGTGLGALGAILETKSNIGGYRKQSLSCVDVAESLEGDESVDDTGNRDIFRQRRTVRDADSRICSNSGMDLVLEE